MKISFRKLNFFDIINFFSDILISKNGVKMNFRIILKNHAADPEKGFLTKSISKPYGHATAMPQAWELRQRYSNLCHFLLRRQVIRSIAQQGRFKNQDLEKF